MGEDTNPEKVDKLFVKRMTVAVFAVISLVLCGLLVKLFMDPANAAATAAACVTLGIVLMLTPRLSELVRFGYKDGSVGAEFERRLTTAERKAQENQNRIDNLFLNSMDEDIFYNLKKLASGHFEHYKRQSALDRQLHHLRDMGYIKCFNIGAIPQEGDDLSRYVTVTEPGKKFVEFREEAEKRQSGSA
jgi:hypothetical protein